jgi:hypothetical protein
MAGDRAITFNHPWLNTKRKYMLCALACFVLVSSVFKMSRGSMTAADNAESAYDRGYIVERGWACDSQSGAMMHLRTNTGAPGCVQINEAVEIVILESRSLVYLVRATRSSDTWWVTQNDFAR